MPRKTKPKKPEAQWVPSDDCEVEVGGVSYFPHLGERVQVISSFTVGKLRLMRRLAELNANMAAVDGDGAAPAIALMDDAFEEAIGVLQGSVVDWDWTDDSGAPLPKPLHNPAAFQGLRIDEIYWLVAATRGETRAQQGNASRPSPTTSSVSAPQPSRS